MFKSRWGFHPCPYETYLKLKHLKKWFWENVTNYCAYRRWHSKQPQNRIGDQPEFCDVFLSVNAKRYSPSGHWTVAFSLELKEFLMDTFDQVRVPSENLVDSLKETTLQRIDDLYEKVSKWYDPDPVPPCRGYQG
jgi:hypothetical protein